MTLVRAFIIVAFIMATATPGYSAASAALAVSATITSTGSCSVNVDDTQDINFGSLDPLNPVNVEANGSINVTCWGFEAEFTVGVTLLTPLPLTLKNGENSIPYTLSFPTGYTGTLPNKIWFIYYGSFAIPITAKISGDSYSLAPAGTYTDTVTIEITP